MNKKEAKELFKLGDRKAQGYLEALEKAKGLVEALHKIKKFQVGTYEGIEANKALAKWEKEK